MNHTYIVAHNAFTVSAPDDLAAWKELEPRFKPFECRGGDTSSLEIRIISAPLPPCDGESIYRPEHDGIGFITAQAWRLADGSLAMEFRHVEECEPRVMMKMPARLDHAEIVIAPDGDSNDTYFLSHALMIAYMLGTSGNGTLLIHASAVTHGSKAYLFQGRSGTGKSTHASLWTRNIDGAELLNDDHPVIRFTADGTAMAYGSPWSGKTHCYRNVAAPIGAFVRIVRGKENVLRQLPLLNAYASLTSSVFFVPFLSDKLRDVRHAVVERLASTVPCYEMHCRPDDDAAITCCNGLKR
ncbi:MAG: hypothetical protein K2L93_03825 [Muribaculaceae bacterium]|nr:hypothetical protein [Muribaculaceae bacterium]MDE6321407.1 hypothetical protein [Muribaculaceae bacterium]